MFPGFSGIVNVFIRVLLYNNLRTQALKIGLITTLNTNIGDDLIRIGIINILKEVLSGEALEIIMVNKHFPAGAGEKFKGCDLLVQCGAPVLWAGCSGCEWADPLWRKVVGPASRSGIPVLNIGAGSCYPWERQPTTIEGPDAEYLREIHSYCRLTTVRDRLTFDLMAGLGLSSVFLPCPAFLSPTDSDYSPGRIVYVNFMSLGGHYDFGQTIDAPKWRETMKAFINRLSVEEDVSFLCHSQAEVDLARASFGAKSIVFPKDPEAYFEVVREAKALVSNRLHASVALGGAGVPSVSIGNDTRMLMIEAFGLPVFYVKEMDADRLYVEVRTLLSSDLRKRLLQDRTRIFQQYVSVVAEAIRKES
jgi:hypothetical protein